MTGRKGARGSKNKEQNHPAHNARTSIAESEPSRTRQLRCEIFPTLYAVFQQSRAEEKPLKIKNRTLRSLVRSCLYHRTEDQLRRTKEDAEALLEKYCARMRDSGLY